MKEKVNVIELCGGVGQTSLGLKKACERLGLQMEVQAFCEIDKFASKAYLTLHDENIPNLGDITRASFKNMECDVLLATTPCTSISMIGKKDGFAQGSDTASAIIWSTFRIIDELKEKPKIIFFENVAAMINKKNLPHFNLLKAALEAKGYNVTYKVLDAKDYGVPQHRERVYIVCTLDDVNFEFPQKEELKIFLKDILEKDTSKHLLMPNEGKEITLAQARGYSYRVHNPSHCEVAFTLTTKSRGQASNNYVFLEDVNDEECVRFSPNAPKGINSFKSRPIRSLSRLELGRLMGMSDDDIHKLDYESNSQFSKQMGNGIVIPVVEKIFYNVLDAYLTN